MKLDNLEERHQFCPKGVDSWCTYQQKKAGVQVDFKNNDPHLDPVFLEFLLPLYTRLSDKKLLKKCVPGFSQNTNESLNALVWNRCPKHKKKGYRHIAIAAGSASLHFNVGASGRHAVMDEMKIPAGSKMVLQSTKKDKKRINQSLIRATDKAKKDRQAVRQAKQRERLQQAQSEAPSYISGGFNEELECVPNTKKRLASSINNDRTSKRKKK